jgi:hypothetical protein
MTFFPAAVELGQREFIDTRLRFKEPIQVKYPLS